MFKIRIEKIHELTKKEYHFTFVPNEFMVGMIRSNISANFMGRGSSVLRVRYNDTVALRAQDIVNTVVKVFLKDQTEEKNLETDRSLKFLDRELEELNRSLNQSANKLNSFKKENEINKINIKMNNTKTLMEIMEKQQQEWADYCEKLQQENNEFELKIDEARAHILEGLKVALDHIDEVIAIIRENDKPKPVLMTRFEITDIQAEAILDLKLRHLAKLEEMKIRGEQEELAEERDYLEKILGSAKRLKTLIRKEIIADAEKYGDDRRSPIVARSAAQAISEPALIPSEAITVALSAKGRVRSGNGQ